MAKNIYFLCPNQLPFCGVLNSLMRKLLSSPVNMALSDAENAIYQNALKYIAEISLNLMAVKVTEHPDDFLGWSNTLLDVCRNKINFDLLEQEQFKPLKKLEDTLISAVSISQLKMTRIAPWPIYVDFIQQQAQSHALEERLSLLDYISSIRDIPLAQMSDTQRLAFSGKHTAMHEPSVFTFDVEWFAGTKGAKIFHLLLEQQPEAFDAALSHIPLTGDVTPAQYQAFVNSYKAIFSSYTVDKPSGEKAPLAAATRLLGMKRPDQFIALTNNKIEALCQGLSIAKLSSNDFDSYWQDMIGTIRTCAWWHQAEPDIGSEQTIEHKIWQARALFVDLFFYADEYLALNSNYIRLRDKANRSNTSTSARISRPKTKQTAEMIVDRALADESLPEYIQGKRESIITEVKNGKSVEHVISLMRAIFG